jgi:outer membrane receptor protein involved in Fe transport
VYAQERTVTIDIPSQAIDKALEMFAEQTDISLIFSTEDVGTAQTRHIKGQYELENALAMLLEDTGLGFKKTGRGIIAINKMSPAVLQTSRDQSAPVLPSTSSVHSTEKNNGEKSKPKAAEEFMLEDTVVTATRRAQSITDVPLSVTAFGTGQIEAQGLKQIDDLIPFTPGLVITRSFNSTNFISIRGIASTAGAATTGIYLDDMPIQVANLGYSSNNTFPGLFDLERVEVLRGPQRTLFGAGSEGGTVRFIQTTPGLDEYSSYVRAEYFSTKGGDPSYEIGAAFGGPIIEGKLGFRISTYYREDGGYIDAIKGTPVVLDPAGDAGPASLTFTDVTVARENTNSMTTTGWRAALKFAVTDSLEITPSVSYQKLEINDGFNVFWLSLSSGDNYARPVFDAGDPATDPALSAYNYPNEESGEDEFYMPALAINWDFGNFELFSNTSFFTRDYIQYMEFTSTYSWFYGLADPTYGFWPGSGQKGMGEYTNTQDNFVQEIRIQSTDDTARLKWVAGLFYSHAKQTGDMDTVVNMLANVSPLANIFWPFAPAVNDGPPFGPGSTAFENWFGVPRESDSSIWAIDFMTKDTQLAGFAQIDYDIAEALTLTLGLRVAHTELDFYNQYRSPENNLNAPMGMHVPLPIDPLYWSAVVQNEETANTPKIGLSYDIDDDNMIYATIAKGFRPAAATQKLPVTLCSDNLIRLGYVDKNGDP